MEGFKKTVNIVNGVSFLVLFLGIILEIFFPIFKFVTITAAVLLYATILIQNRLQRGSFDKILCVLCSLAMIWMFLNEFTESQYVGILGMIVVYLFVMRAVYSTTGSLNKVALVCGGLSICCALLNLKFESAWFGYAIIGLQIITIVKFIDPILEQLGQAHRAKRLAAEAAEKELVVGGNKNG